MSNIVKLTEVQKNLVNKNKQLIQKLNTEVHLDNEVREILSEVFDEPVDASTEIRLPFFTDSGFNIHLGKNVFINSGVTFTDLGGIYVEDGVLIGPNASLISVNHPIDPKYRHDLELKPVRIKQNAWIGSGAIILPGVTVGKNSVVGAGAVVTKDVPDDTIVAGVPAQLVRQIEE